MSRTLRKWLWFFGVILAFGGLRLAIEPGLQKELREEGLLYKPPVAEMRSSGLTAQGVLAALGGFGSPLASYLDVQAYVHFNNSEFVELDQMYHLVTALQPYADYYWVMAGWHTGYNASTHLKSNPGDRRPAVLERDYRMWVDRGRDYFERGVASNPDSSQLHMDLAMFHTAQFPYSRDRNPEKAARHFLRAHEITGRPHFERMAAFEMVFLHDKERWEQAYGILKHHYLEVPNAAALPSVIRDLRVLEERLEIPSAERVSGS